MKRHPPGTSFATNLIARSQQTTNNMQHASVILRINYIAPANVTEKAELQVYKGKLNVIGEKCDVRSEK